jgi:hypothetical protein
MTTHAYSLLPGHAAEIDGRRVRVIAPVELAEMTDAAGIDRLVCIVRCVDESGVSLRIVVDAEADIVQMLPAMVPLPAGLRVRVDDDVRERRDQILGLMHAGGLLAVRAERVLEAARDIVQLVAMLDPEGQALADKIDVLWHRLHDHRRNVSAAAMRRVLALDGDGWLRRLRKNVRRIEARIPTTGETLPEAERRLALQG